ncbi:NAD-dependent epimerase/dehydratase family protein [Paenibacillus donghaensis]|uniref:3-beta hydroxysteroid dehydrogenase n=1 Tax=Paenibacillus donghaensis TaxID=414771 RepID=A0A2Z2KCU3_9BACL|nr:NAD-dependent epimerase/dehydratase family protein [Paenibacillus donghaensis]ASA20820.1 3-beta hydroxysteroid dehydrogenase [Paenibacillus donghaensis]
MTKALVTGATGFLGRHTVRRLIQLGWEVSALGRSREAGEQLKRDGAVFMAQDLRNTAEIIRSCAGQDYVFHCGALSSPWGKYSEFYGCNVEGTRNIVAGCLKHGVGRLIHISTPSVYFNYQNRLGLSEEAELALKPANAYAATKRLAELEVERAASSGLVSVILRPRAIFGPMDNALFPRILSVNEGKGVPLLDGGIALIDLTYVDNVVDAMLLGSSAPDAATGRIYNISNGEPMPFVELLTSLFAKLDIPLHTRSVSYRTAHLAAGLLEGLHRLLPGLGEPALTRYSVGSLALSQTLDISLARSLLGYEPRITVAEGLQNFADWWREQK